MAIPKYDCLTCLKIWSGPRENYLYFYVNLCLRWINCLLPLRELGLKLITPTILPGQLYFYSYFSSSICIFIKTVWVLVFLTTQGIASVIDYSNKSIQEYRSTHPMEFLLSNQHPILSSTSQLFRGRFFSVFPASLVSFSDMYTSLLALLNFQCIS